MRTLSALVLLSAVLAACSSTPLETAKPPADESAKVPPSDASRVQAPSALPAATPEASSLAAHLDPANIIYRDRSIYFDFDEVTVPAQYVPVVERQGRYLAANPALKIVVEGHADERGSSEYNLALGQRRAQSVKASLQLYGVKESQVEAVSFGEEKPSEAGHDEASWSRNRRADIAYRK